MNYIKLTGMFLFSCSMIMISFNKKHLINLFIILEFLVLSVLMIVISFGVSHSGIIMLTLCLGVSEAGLCLSLLFMMMRNHGSDLISILSIF